MSRLNNTQILRSSPSSSESFDISDKSSGTYTVKILPEGLTYQIVKN